MSASIIELHRLPWGQFRCVNCAQVSAQYQPIEDGRYEDTRCFNCYHAHKQKTVNPIQMGNRYNHQWTGADRLYRYRVSDQPNLLTAREAKRHGLTCKRDGRMSRYYDGDGTLLFAYSYNTCIYARVFDADENMYRDVFNMTPYSSKSGEHVSAIMHELLGISHWMWVEGYTIDYGDWQPGVITPRFRVAFSPRIRRVIELVRVEADTSHRELARLGTLAMPKGAVAP